VSFGRRPSSIRDLSRHSSSSVRHLSSPPFSFRLRDAASCSISLEVLRTQPLRCGVQSYTEHMVYQCYWGMGMQSGAGQMIDKGSSRNRCRSCEPVAGGREIASADEIASQLRRLARFRSRSLLLMGDLVIVRLCVSLSHASRIAPSSAQTIVE
jgi:hypothetical protein